jgi:hypothetical protein
VRVCDLYFGHVFILDIGILERRMRFPAIMTWILVELETSCDSCCVFHKVLLTKILVARGRVHVNGALYFKMILC